MNSQKSFLKKAVHFVLVLSVASASCLPFAAPAKAGGPQDMVINMGMDFVKSIGGKILMQQLFPEKGFDYDRIRKDMEEVTRTVITDAMITEAFAKIDAAGINA